MKKAIWTAVIAAAGVVATPATLHAAVMNGWQHGHNQSGFGAPDSYVAVAEGRVGDQAQVNFDRTKELGLGSDATSPAVTEDFSWNNGSPTNFSLNFDSILNKLTFTVQDKTLEYEPAGYFDQLLVRTRATQPKSSALVENLVLNGIAVNDSSFADGNVPGHDYDMLTISGADLMSGFTLTGQATLSWGKSSPPNSLLFFQVFLADGGGVDPGDDPTSQVPEPASAALAASGLLFIFGGRPKRKPMQA